LNPRELSPVLAVFKTGLAERCNRFLTREEVAYRRLVDDCHPAYIPYGGGRERRLA
jgi:hypothetical protein